MSGELRALEVAKLTSTVYRSAVGTNNGAAFDLRPYDGDVRIVLNTSAGGGTSPTLDVKIQHSDDGAAFVDAGLAFSQVTAAGGYQVLAATAKQFRRFIRTVDVVGGTSPTIAFGVTILAKRRA